MLRAKASLGLHGEPAVAKRIDSLGLGWAQGCSVYFLLVCVRVSTGVASR